MVYGTAEAKDLSIVYQYGSLSLRSRFVLFSFSKYSSRKYGWSAGD